MTPQAYALRSVLRQTLNTFIGFCVTEQIDTGPVITDGQLDAAKIVAIIYADQPQSVPETEAIAMAQYIIAYMTSDQYKKSAHFLQPLPPRTVLLGYIGLLIRHWQSSPDGANIYTNGKLDAQQIERICQTDTSIQEILTTIGSEELRRCIRLMIWAREFSGAKSA